MYFFLERKLSRFWLATPLHVKEFFLSEVFYESGHKQRQKLGIIL